MKKFFKDRNKITAWLEEHNVENYTLIPDEIYGFKINIDGNVILYMMQIGFIPVKFNIVRGHFDCIATGINSLEFAPHEVTRDFACSFNDLQTLDGCPSVINGNLECFYCSLISLRGCPKIIHGNFQCSNNELTSLEFGPKEVRGLYDCSNNNLSSLEGCPARVTKDFICNNNNLLSLDVFPYSVGGHIDLKGNNSLYSLQEIKIFNDYINFLGCLDLAINLDINLIEKNKECAKIKI